MGSNFSLSRSITFKIGQSQMIEWPSLNLDFGLGHMTFISCNVFITVRTNCDKDIGLKTFPFIISRFLKVKVQ